MKQLLITFLIFITAFQNLHAQQNNAEQWKSIDASIHDGLTKTALKKVNSLFLLNQRKNNQAEEIKCLLYIVRLNQNLSENAPVQNIKTIDSIATKADKASKAILLSIEAEMYWNFLRQNSYKFYNRTNTTNFHKTDINTWTVSDLNKKIEELYSNSLRDKNLLQKIDLEQFAPIIMKGNTRKLRPTLYDFLAHRALEYFTSGESDITRPAYFFQLRDSAAFAPVKDFSTHKFMASDSLSYQYKALHLYQDLLHFHLPDINPQALIDADMDRLQFSFQFSSLMNKEDLFINGLTKINEQYKQEPASAQALFIVAQEILNQDVKNHNVSNTSQKNNTVISKTLLDQIILQYPKSEGAINAQNLLNDILHKSLSLTLEKVNLPAEPFRTLVTYTNISKVYLRIIKSNSNLKTSLTNLDNDQKWKILSAASPLLSWSQPLPLPSDYHTHATEIKIDSLPLGEYYLIASDSGDFNTSTSVLSGQQFFVSNISYITHNNEVFVLHRKTGLPLVNATVQFIPNHYNNKPSTVSYNAFQTDHNGYGKIIANDLNNFGNLDITYKNDHLSLEDFMVIQNYVPGKIANKVQKDSTSFENENSRFFLFTDRSIYRPGQLVYFKAIGSTKSFNSNQSKLIESKDPIRVFLQDSNGQQLDSLELLLNDYGSVHGYFKLPENLLNGRFTIVIKQFNISNAAFSVEQYKRPTFYIQINKPTKQFHLSENVMITGNAKAYAGNNIKHATVKYHVTRFTRILYDWMWRSQIRPNTPSQEIANGTTTTNDDGSFNLPFIAIPDALIDSNLNPSFNFKIDVEITDINGETKSTSLNIPLGYTSTILNISIKNEQPINIDSLKSLFVSSTNLSGDPIACLVKLQLYKVTAPNRLIRKRYWEAPDQFVMSKEEYQQFFPNDEYNNELDPSTWARPTLAYESTDTANKFFKLSDQNFQAGWYVAEAITREPNGTISKDIKYLQLFSTKESEPLKPLQYNLSAIANNVLQPGENLQIIQGSSANNVLLIQQIIKSSNVDSSTCNFFRINNEVRKFEVPVTENDRGNIQVNQFFVKENRIYNSHFEVAVPWKNKQLNISIQTFRDKTIPGSEENWKVKITRQGQPVAAEMLATMYDASLDLFSKHTWPSLNKWDQLSRNFIWNAQNNFTIGSSFQNYLPALYILPTAKQYDDLIMHPYIQPYRGGIMYKNTVSGMVLSAAPNERQAKQLSSDHVAFKIDDSSNGEMDPAPPPSNNVRTNFNETAFFYPNLRTDSQGNIEFNFKMPDALTQWKFMAIAHSLDLASGYAEKTILTQKELMVQPNVPRFVKQGDKIILTTKVVNLHSGAITGKVYLRLIDAVTLMPVDSIFKNIAAAKLFDLDKSTDKVIEFPIQVPNDFIHPITYRFTAESKEFIDAEESTIPVLSNKLLVTESLPLYMNGEGKKEYTFNKLLNSKQSSTIRNIGLSVEYTTNPIWYVLQALPYIIESKEESSEQVFNRFYANSIASKIINTTPQIKNLFQHWKNNDSASLKSNLQKNTELKSLLLQETPWVLEGQDETQQKKNIALIFDNSNMNAQKSAMIKKLQQMQLPNGSFSWYKGGREDVYMTQYILSGLGHLKKLYAITIDKETKTIITNGLRFLDIKNKERYEWLLKNKNFSKGNQLNNVDIQYLYMRSFFPEFAIAKDCQKAYNFFMEQSGKNWLSTSIYMQGMIALYLHRSADIGKSSLIIKSLRENAINNEELGMYWKQLNQSGYWWYQAPIESQSVLIEAFSEIDKDQKTVAALQTWLIKNKQVNNWKSTKATADACYALLINGNTLLEENKKVVIKLGTTIISSTDSESTSTIGYLKRSIKPEDVTPSMGKIITSLSSDNKNSAAPSWGAVYWQYLENADNITFSETPLKLQKNLFIETITEKGSVLTPVSNNTILHIGDRIKVRIELRVDRDMEYIHMRDMRASDLETENVLSSYKYQDGLGYYETTKDASTDFFFDHLYKGTYVFEYPLIITHKGNFSNGITNIECLYAPEFSAHSEGVRIEVK